jgi:phage/plasmid-associated DNA primase
VVEYPGILNGMIRGYQDQKNNGLILPESVRHANETQHDQNDTVVNWMEDAVTIDPQSKESFNNLHDSYTNWCRRNGEKDQDVKGTRQFGQWLNDNGFKKERSVRIGLCLNSRGIRVKSLDT